ncbi:hypothetical protein TUBRATIS_27740 [Tubulinosema ratisbonensis]|uniref:Uncharacterized protein n=1 Tax=Tubulinosema ratisbonensis TaxID=291195 RepID=A0A437AI53_9MICR|nr:hypothetical protein TUBRATIS_27740 [Tubulinosema ratisbonensis]
MSDNTTRTSRLKALFKERDREIPKLRKRIKSNLRSWSKNLSNTLFILISFLLLSILTKYKDYSLYFYLTIFIISFESVNLLICAFRIYNFKKIWFVIHLITSLFKLILIIHLYFNHLRRMDMVRHFFLPENKVLEISELVTNSYFVYLRVIYFLQIFANILIFSGKLFKKFIFLSQLGTLLIGIGYFLLILTLKFSSNFDLLQTFIGQIQLFSFLICLLISYLQISKKFLFILISYFILFVNCLYFYTTFYLILSFNVIYFELLICLETGIVLSQDGSADFIKMVYHFIKLKLIQMIDVSDSELISID